MPSATKTGKLKSVNDNTAQALFVIENKDKEVLIPINDEFIEEVNHDKKLIVLNTPEGLIDIYL